MLILSINLQWVVALIIIGLFLLISSLMIIQSFIKRKNYKNALDRIKKIEKN